MTDWVYYAFALILAGSGITVFLVALVIGFRLAVNRAAVKRQVILAQRMAEAARMKGDWRTWAGEPIAEWEQECIERDWVKGQIDQLEDQWDPPTGRRYTEGGH